jgi:hypothetical protein
MFMVLLPLLRHSSYAGHNRKPPASCAARNRNAKALVMINPDNSLDFKPIRIHISGDANARASGHAPKHAFK